MIQVSWLGALLLFITDTLDRTELSVWAKERTPWAGLAFVFGGASYAFGALLFGYAASQYLTATLLILTGTALSITDIRPTFRLYATCVVSLMVAAVLYFYWMCVLEYGVIDLPKLSETVRRFGVLIAAILWVTLVQGMRHNVFSEKMVKGLAKAIVAVIVVGFAYQRQRFKVLRSRS